MKHSPQAKYQRAIRALRDRLEISHSEAQQTYRSLKRETGHVTATSVKRISKESLLSHAPESVRHKIVPAKGERVIFAAKKTHGALWSEVQNFHEQEIERRLYAVPGIELVVNVTLHIFENVNKPWRTKLLTFTTSHDDFWTDYHDALRDDFEGDEYGSSYNVGAISVAAV